MGSRLCPGCGRRVPDDFDACLRCGSDVSDGLRVSTVTGVPQPPAPPAPTWPHPGSGLVASAPAGWMPPSASARPFTGAQEAARWLAAGGQSAVGILYALAAVAALASIGSGGRTSVIVSLGLRTLLAAIFLRKAWRLVTRPDKAILKSAIGLSFGVMLLFTGEAIATGGGILTIGVAVVPGIAGVLAVVAYRLFGDSIPERLTPVSWWDR